MSEIVVNGGRKISGEISVQGAKNSVLPLLAACVLINGQCEIHNCPNISDVWTSLKILDNLGFKCNYKDNIATIDGNTANGFVIEESLMREMRSSIVFLGAILGRAGKAVISSPGGCELGPRPIDMHISSLKKMGVSISTEHGQIVCNADGKLKGTEIHLDFPSVGATETIILAACLANGVTVINNAAKEPEISDLADFLNSAGAKIYGSGSDRITINGVEKLNPVIHTVIPDRIVASTYMAAAAMTGGTIKLNNVMPSHLVSVTNVLSESGCEIEVKPKSIILNAPKRLLRVPTVRSLVYPGVPTDAGPIIVSMLSLANGTSVFVENIFQNRFRYIDELKRFGAKIKTERNVAIVEGVKSLSATTGQCTDLRGGAAILLAALAANGQSHITDISHILRGYENICENLCTLGADVYIKES